MHLSTGRASCRPTATVRSTYVSASTMVSAARCPVQALGEQAGGCRQQLIN